MIPEEIIHHLLATDADVAALVGSTGVHPAVIPEGTPLPAIAYRRIDAVDLHRPLYRKPGSYALCRARMRVAVLTLTDGAGYVAAKTVLQAVRKACSSKVGLIAGYAGTSTSAPLASPELPDPVTGLTQEACDFMVTYREPLA